MTRIWRPGSSVQELPSPDWETRQTGRQAGRPGQLLAAAGARWPVGQTRPGSAGGTLSASVGTFEAWPGNGLTEGAIKYRGT